MILEGAEVSDGQFAALLTGPGLPAGGVEAVNQGDFFVFPALTFTREHLGAHTYRVQAVVREPQRGYVYDQVIHQAQVVISLDEAGQLTAALAAPVVIRHAYTPDHALVRVYADVQPGRLLAVGDSVRFTAETSTAACIPVSWLFSADNATGGHRRRNRASTGHYTTPRQRGRLLAGRRNHYGLSRQLHQRFNLWTGG